MVKRSDRKQKLLFPWSLKTSMQPNIARIMAQIHALNMESTRLDHISSIFRSLPVLEDQLQTETSEAQSETIAEVYPYILGTEGGPHELNSHGIPKIRRQAHIAFLRKTLDKMPAAYTAYDAARPWVIYWTLTALCLLGQDVSGYREQTISTLAAAQHISGGFGGGDGQMPHIATTFAAVLSLAMVGGSAAFDMIDRRAMWKWLGQVKDRDGGFRMAIGAELDARGVYCSMVIITLLNLPLELPADAPARQAGLVSFLDGIPEWISRCQSYEGGISARPNGEAHAAYTFCGLACLSIIGDPKETLNKYLDINTLLNWLSSRQNAPEGGFSGRSNKLVDSCYSHWVGGCWYLVDQALRSSDAPNPPSGIWNKEGIIRYILCAAQNEKGGMRDKPSKRPDGYHSCYALAGLSAMQHEQVFRASSMNMDHPLGSAFDWTVIKKEPPFVDQFFDEDDFLEPLHPIFTIPHAAVEGFRRQALGKQGF